MSGVVTLHEHLITPLGGKIATALRVAPEKALFIVAHHSFRATKLQDSRREQSIFRGNRFKISYVNRASHNAPWRDIWRTLPIIVVKRK